MPASADRVASRRESSGFSEIDPRVHDQIDRAVSRASNFCAKARGNLHGLTSSMYPPESHELEEIRGMLRDAMSALDDAERLLPK